MNIINNTDKKFNTPNITTNSRSIEVTDRLIIILSDLLKKEDCQWNSLFLRKVREKINDLLDKQKL